MSLVRRPVGPNSNHLLPMTARIPINPRARSRAFPSSGVRYADAIRETSTVMTAGSLHFWKLGPFHPSGSPARRIVTRRHLSASRQEDCRRVASRRECLVTGDDQADRTPRGPGWVQFGAVSPVRTRRLRPTSERVYAGRARTPGSRDHATTAIRSTIEGMAALVTGGGDGDGDGDDDQLKVPEGQNPVAAMIEPLRFVPVMSPSAGASPN
jgi:hypothetical protein